MSISNLPNLIKRLKGLIDEDSPESKIQKLADEIARRLKIKQDRFRTNPNIKNFHEWSAIVRENPSNIEYLLTVKEFECWIRRDVDISFTLGIEGKTIFSKEFDVEVINKRFKNRILLENPYLALDVGYDGIVVQSWSRPKSISYAYKRHLPNKRKGRTRRTENADKSKFFRNIDIVGLEELMFNQSVGVMTSIDTIRFYASFDKEVGYHQGGEKTEFVRMECTRLRRQKDRGFKCNIHAYPYNKHLLNRDIGSSEIVNKIIENKISCPLNTVNKNHN